MVKDDALVITLFIRSLNSVKYSDLLYFSTSISANGIVRILVIPITHAEQMYLLSISILVEL